MSKKAIFIFILIFIIFFIIGFTIQNIKMSKKETIKSNQRDIANTINDPETIEVNSSDEKTTPNTILVLKKKYTDCGHEISSRATMPKEMVNLTKEEIEKKYPNWKLEEFGIDKIVLSKTVDSFCGEHYLLIEENGNINIYSIDEKGERSFRKKADISIEYLPETDRITLRNGIMVYGTENLNKILEDYDI